MKDIDVAIPLARFVCVTGVSGSGKSSLVNDILWNRLARDLNGTQADVPGKHRAIEGATHLDKIIDIDQTPIGRTPRSNPATYIKVFDEIRDLYASLPDAKVRGYKPGRFSFNVKSDARIAAAASAGRCEACDGNGANRIEMDFLADVWVTCPVCNGHRFNRETLQIHFKGKSIADVLEMDVQQALDHFESVPKITHMLRTLHAVGLDYIKLGQPSTTLSGGEAQRIKLARELVKRATGRTLYILDEPTTGLHFDDIRKLLEVLHGFVDVGNTVLVIEHNLDVIKTADWIIDLGPEGGEAGGFVVATGTPEQVAGHPTSYTAAALRRVLNGSPRGASSRPAAGRTRRARRSTDSSPGVIRVIGASEHNLRNVSVDIPRNAITLCAGVSGSGKSSLAMDTIYVEGQRRYVESLSAYARQFLGQFQKPKVEHISGLSPAIAIEQKNASKSPRSTVGTVTEIYDYMRVLWARLGRPYCPRCNVPVGTQTPDEIIDAIMRLPAGSRLLICAPIERGEAESYDALLARLRGSGYARIRLDGVVHSIESPPMIDGRRRHALEVVVDRVVIQPTHRSRIADSVEHGLSIGNGIVWVAPADGGGGSGPGPARRFSQHRSCEQCGRSFDELTPHHFSFNSRLGWCPTCEGLGVQRGTRDSTVAVHPERSLLDGAIAGWTWLADRPLLRELIVALAHQLGFDAKTPWKDLTDEQRHAMLYGTGDHWIEVRARDGASTVPLRVQFKGFFPAIDEATRMSWQYRLRLEDLVTEIPCQVCHGGRLRAESAAARLADRTIVEVSNLPLRDAMRYFVSLKASLSRVERKIAGELLHEISSRVRFLNDVGLEYLTLHRAAPTLSGGEAQRIQLAAQIGSGLTGVLYVLDEPTVGLHPRDTQRLVAALHRLRDIGNTLLVVEHDREVITQADRILDFGPGAGIEGGQIIAAGAPADLRSSARSVTGRYLAGRASIIVPSDRRPVVVDGCAAPKEWLRVTDARHNNLAGISADFPLGRFVAVTGVSGSGKSSLIIDVLYSALAQRLHHARVTPGPHREIRGLQFIDKAILVDQSPIGNSPLSNPCTYTGAFDLIRELFARLPESRVRGYNPNRFSFNRPGGRCEDCEGLGQVCYEMHFLPDVWVQCDVCAGKRFNPETLEIRYKDKSIADVLEMRITDALRHFAAVPRIRRLLQTLVDVGLGYLSLGQSAPTLSGGEAQRVKLAAELGRVSTGRTLYVLDEPTTGLHLEDIRKLLAVLHRLVEQGNTVVCIEHNLDVIKTADWVIDLGPEAGADGGRIVAAATPEGIAACRDSHTGRMLKPLLEQGPRAPREQLVPPAPVEPPADTSESVPADAAVRMPWQRDGRRWHTRDRLSRCGDTIEWDGAALEFIVSEIERLGRDRFEPTDWSDRTRVEIRARRPPGCTAEPVGWFLHALTGSRWLLDLSFRVPTRTFASSELAARLRLKPLDERDDLPVYGRAQRVRIRPASPELDQVRIWIHDRPEVTTPAFRSFLKTAVRAYLGYAASLFRDKSKARPWITDGRTWHLSQRAVPPGPAPDWKPALLLEVIGRITKHRKGLRPDWGRKTVVALSDASGGTVARIHTNLRPGLRLEISVPRGRFTPTQIERLGVQPRVVTGAQSARIECLVTELSQLDSATLSTVLADATATASVAD